MPKKHRAKRDDFAAAARGLRIVGSLFSVSISPKSAGSALAACTVSKKVAPLAVERNRIKRQCREAVRPVLAHYNAPCLLVFVARREARDADARELRSDARALAEKALARYNPTT